MTVRKWFLALVIFFVAPIVSYASDPGDVFLHLTEGDVQMTTADTQDWVPAASNTPLFEGDKVWVPYDGRAEIRLNDGTSARLAYGAALEIGPPEEEGHHFYLDQGRCYVNFPGPGGSPSRSMPLTHPSVPMERPSSGSMRLRMGKRSSPSLPVPFPWAPRRNRSICKAERG